MRQLGRAHEPFSSRRALHRARRWHSPGLAHLRPSCRPARRRSAGRRPDRQPHPLRPCHARRPARSGAALLPVLDQARHAAEDGGPHRDDWPLQPRHQGGAALHADDRPAGPGGTRGLCLAHGRQARGHAPLRLRRRGGWRELDPVLADGRAPVARKGGTDDHRRSAFGRCVAEAVFWSPASLLPRPGVAWQEVDESTSRVTVSHDGMEQSVDVKVGGDGRRSRSSSNAGAMRTRTGCSGCSPSAASFPGSGSSTAFACRPMSRRAISLGPMTFFPFFIADVTESRSPRHGLHAHDCRS